MKLEEFLHAYFLLEMGGRDGVRTLKELIEGFTKIDKVQYADDLRKASSGLMFLVHACEPDGDLGAAEGTSELASDAQQWRERINRYLGEETVI